MAIGNQRYAVRVTYRDGSSAMFGPVRSRSEARRLAEQVSGPQATARILRWSSTETGVGGVLSRRPAPIEPASVVPEEPTILTVEYDADNDELIVTGTGLADTYYLNFAGNGSGQLNADFHFTVTDTVLTVSNANFALNGGTLTSIDLFEQDSTPIASWTGSVDLFDPTPLLGYTLLGHGYSSNQGGFGITKDTVGRIVVAAHVTDGGDGSSAGVFRLLDEDGTLDTDWGSDGLVSYDHTTPNIDAGAVGIAVAGDSSVFAISNWSDGSDSQGELLKYLDSGALDTGFDTDGVIATNGPGNNAQQAVFTENGNGYVVVGTNSNGTDGVIDRYARTTGAAVDGYAFPAGTAIRGMLKLAQGQYLVALRDGLGDNYLSLVDIDLQTANTQPQTVIDPANGQSAVFGLTTSGGAYFVSGRSGGFAAVAKYDNSLVLDTNFGIGGVLTLNPGDWLDGSAEQLVAIPGGDIVACGWYADNSDYGWMTARFDSSGSLDPGYGVAGYAEVNPGSNDAMIYAAALDADDTTRLLVTGYTNAGTAETAVGRILVADGTLDTTFGDAA